MAQKTGTQHDFTVMQAWALGTDGVVYLLDQCRGKYESPELLDVARAFWKKHKAAGIEAGYLTMESRWGGWLPLPASECQSVEAVKASTSKEPSVMEISTIGLDLAKSIFQVHAINDAGAVVVRKALRRSQVLPFFAKLPQGLVGMEACGTSHHWARELIKLGHEVRLMPPAYVKPYVKRGKTDANDAEAICEAVTRPTMRFVPVKSPEQQAALALHRTRDLLVKQRTQLVNMIRGLLAEFGIEMARGLHHALALAKQLTEGRAADVPQLAQRVVASLAHQVGALQEQLAALEKELVAWHRSSELSQRLATIPGVGVISATALAASVSEPERFRSGRQFAASLGLTPLQQSSGGKEKMGRISKMGDRYLRRLLVVGMTSLVRRARCAPASVDPRIPAMLERRPARVVTVAAANRTARVAWAIMTRGGTYRKPIAAVA